MHDHTSPHAARASSLDLALMEHGAWRVLRAAALALLTHRPQPPAPPDYLREDLGLPPVRRTETWTLYL